MKDQALIEAITAIRELAPDVKNTIASIATLNEKVANLEGNSKTALDLLVTMQKNEEELQRARLKAWAAFGMALLTAIVNVAMAYLNYKR